TQSGDTSQAGDPAAPGATAAPDDDVGRDLTEAELASIPKPSMRKRLERFMADRAQLRGEVAQLKEPATHWQQHVTFLQANNIRPEDANALYGAGAFLGRGDFANFIAIVQPYYDAARA